MFLPFISITHDFCHLSGYNVFCIFCKSSLKSEGSGIKTFTSPDTIPNVPMGQVLVLIQFILLNHFIIIWAISGFETHP